MNLNQCCFPSDIGHDHRQDRVSQQPSSVHAVRPKQPPAEGQNAAFGHHSVGFLGHTSGVTVNQNTIPNVTGILYHSSLCSCDFATKPFTDWFSKFVNLRTKILESP